MDVDLTLRSPLSQTWRVARVQGQFDVPAASEQIVKIKASLPIEDRDWQIGAIVGASGSGKSSIARHLWPDAVHASANHEWNAESIIDDFPESMSADDVIGLLSAVGLSSAPAWLRPYRALSEGQRMRASLARTLALPAQQEGSQGESTADPLVYDEYTSVVDRVVAKAVSNALAKHVRRTNKRFVAVTCHRDVLPWLGADWFYDLDSGAFTWGSLQRPRIELVVREGARSSWSRFHQHHYLSASLANSSRVFLGYAKLEDEDEERLVAFNAILPVAGHRGWWRSHRLVVLPDYQGLGIGNAFNEAIAETLWTKERKRYRITTSAPGVLHYARKRPHIWRLHTSPIMKGPVGPRSAFSKNGKKGVTSAGRLTANLVYMPTELRK